MNFKVKLYLALQVILLFEILIKIYKLRILKMINWQVIGQLVSTGMIMLLGPAIIVLLALKKGNL